MATKLTPSQAATVRTELGIEPKPVPVEVQEPTPREAVPTGADIVAAEREAAAAPGPSLMEEAQAAFRVDNTMGRLLIEPEQFPIDLSYDAGAFIKDNQPRIDALWSADHDEVAQLIGTATSNEEAESRLRGMEQDFADEQLLIAGGGSALAMRLGAALLDPVDATVALSIGGVAGALAKGGRIGRIVTSAVSAAGAAGATEAVLAQDNVFRDETDVAIATLAGLTLGGALGSLTSSETRQINKLADEVAKGHIDDAAARMGLGESAGAARARPQSVDPNAPLKETAEILEDMEAPDFKYRGWNYLLGNLQSKLFYSKSDTVRKVSSAMFEGGFLRDKSKTRGLTVESRANQLQDVFERGVYAETLQDFNGWAKRNKKGTARRLFTTSVGEEFYSEVGLAMRGITRGISPEAMTAAGKIRKYMDNVHDLAARAKVKGFERAALEDYFPRMINKSRFADMRVRLGDQGLQRFFRDAIIKGGNDIDDELADKIARGYVRAMRMKSAGLENDLLHGIRLDDVDRLREVFDGYDEIDELIAEIEAIKAREMADRGSVSFGKRRIQFDETHFDDVVGVNGESFRLNFTDLYENDARLVLSRYGKAMHGHIAMAETLGVRSRGDFEEFKQAIAVEVENLGGDARTQVQALDDGYNMLLGQPIERWNPNGDVAKLSRTMAGYNYATRGGQFGVNALAEIGNIVGQGGLRTLFRVFPDMKNVMKRAADGQLEAPLARTAELMFAPGIQTLTKPAVRNLDELAEDFAGTSVITKFTEKLDPLIKSAGRFTSIASGLGPITDATQRVAAVTYIEKLARFANRAPGKKQIERMRANGINADMQERIFAQLRESGAGVYRKGRLIDIDLERWTDDAALDVFSQAASREVRNAIQMTDISTSTLLFNHPMGRLLFQFMRFPMDAVNKQFLRGIHHADAETATAWVSSFAIGATVYMAQTSIEYANDPEERAKRLDPANVAKVGFMRTGFSSMLPAPIDTGRTMLGLDPMFAMGRTSGLATAFPLTSNPTISALKNFDKGVVGAVRSSVHDDIQYSQADFRAASQLIPGYRMLGFKNAFYALEQQFPESRQQE